MHSIPRHSDVALIHTAHVTRVGEMEIGTWLGSGWDVHGYTGGVRLQDRKYFFKIKAILLSAGKM